MQQVITQKEAREITGGRTPLVPVEYEQALKSLDACLTLDEAKYWSDKADALAAWAKIHRSRDAEVKSKRLKLYAFRRMGILAAELRPRGQMLRKSDGRSARGTSPGPQSALVENGLNKRAAQAARRLALIPEERFKSLIGAEKPLSPWAATASTADRSDTWNRVIFAPTGLASFRSFCRHHPASEVANGLRSDEVEKARGIAIEAIEWLDKFEQHLPSVEK